MTELTEIKIEVPRSFVSFFNIEKPKSRHSILVQSAMLLYPYIKNDVISYGRAAEMLGIKKTQILDIYEEIGLPLVSYSVSEIDGDVCAIRKACSENDSNL